MTKEDQLKELYGEYTRQFAGKEIVVGEGNADSELMLIGEAPGRDEVKLSRPFVGIAGKNLNEFLEISGIERDSIYITNVIKYRLSRVNENTGRVSNRPATKEDIEENRQYLIREIEIISPHFIVTLGNVPLRSVTGDRTASVGEKHGKLEEIIVGDSKYQLFALYHPASIIYNRSLKETYTGDICKLRSLMG